MNFINGQRFLKEKKFNKALDVFVNLEKNNYFDDRIYFYLGIIYFELNHFDKSIYYYNKFLSKNPTSSSTLLNLAIVKQTVGDLESAREIYLKLINQNKQNIRAYYGLYLLDVKNFEQKNFEILSNIKKSNKLNLYDLAIIDFLLSKREKKQNKIKREIEYLNKFHKNIFNSNFDYNNSSQFYYEKIIKKNFDKINIFNKNNDPLKTTNIEPIFIIGLPRSGSTVIESILTSSKEKISTYGECHVFNMSIFDQISTKIYSNNFDQSKFNFEIDLKKINTAIVEKYSQYIPFENIKANKFIDKSLENFFNIEIIYKNFPKVKFLHTYRNPLDSVISIYQSMLPDLSWAHSIEHILSYLDSYNQVINYFKEKYPNLILDVNLEDLTEDSVKISKKIFNFCELTWDDEILNFYKRKDLFSKTLSFTQIRSKVKKYDLEKYRPYYNLLNKFKHKYKWLQN